MKTIRLHAAEFESGIAPGHEINLIPFVGNDLVGFHVVHAKTGLEDVGVNFGTYSLKYYPPDRHNSAGMVMLYEEGPDLEVRKPLKRVIFDAEPGAFFEPWTDGYALGIKVGDQIFCMNPSTGGDSPDFFFCRGVPEDSDPICFINL